jgi:Ni,Fe-hydrogenase III small subunit
MKLTRRSFVATGSAATALLGTGSLTSAQAKPALVVYDSRIARSAAFAQGHAAQRMDIASEGARRWRALRDVLPEGPVIGLTKWSDYVLVRGFAEEQRKRLKREQRVGDLHLWELG